MQATALGRYLLYGPDGRMPAAARRSTRSSPTTTPGPPADWRVEDAGATVRLVERLAPASELGVGALGRLAQVAPAAPRWSLVPPQGCASFPEIEVNVTGTPLKGSSPTAPVRGFLDDHIHIGAFEFLGGRFHCGRPWSPYGVTVALRDCADHYPNGAAAVVENFISTGGPVGTHSPEGWPSFAGWPRDESQTHEGTYWKWIERAWRSGLRIMVNDLVENRALCDLYPLKQNNCNEMVSAYKQADDMHALQDYIDAQFGGPGKGFLRIVKTPAEARKVINEGKLGDGARRSRSPRCSTAASSTARRSAHAAQIDSELDKLYAAGVRSLFPVHKFDNALGGTHFDSGTHRRARQHRQQVRHRPVLGGQPLRRRRPRQRADQPDRRARRHDLHALRTGADAAAVPGPAAGLSARAALQPEGPHRARRARDPRDDAARHDRRDRPHEREGAPAGALDPRGDQVPGRDLEPQLGRPRQPEAAPEARRPGRPDLDARPTASSAEWRTARANRDTALLLRHRLRLGHQRAALAARAAAQRRRRTRSRYPFRSFDGGSVINQQRSGTRVYDINTDGVDHYGLYPDWIEDLRMVAGAQIVDDMANGAEAYLQMWARAEAAAG